MTLQLRSVKPFTTWGIALVLFAAGYLVASRFGHPIGLSADGNRVFELRVYHTLPGKLPVMESRFREKTSKLLAKHNVNVVGYWVSDGGTASDTSFIFLIAHQSRDDAKANWDSMIHDPEFQQVERAEQTERTLKSADLMYMRPTDFSSMK